jgi:hypothetical protein
MEKCCAILTLFRPLVLLSVIIITQSMSNCIFVPKIEGQLATECEQPGLMRLPPMSPMAGKSHHCYELARPFAHWKCFVLRRSIPFKQRRWDVYPGLDAGFSAGGVFDAVLRFSLDPSPTIALSMAQHLLSVTVV